MASPMPQDTSRLQPNYSLPPPPPALDPREPAAPPITSPGGHIHTSRNRSTGTPRTPCTPTRSPAPSPVSSRAASPNPGLDNGRQRERGSFGANFQSHTFHGSHMVGGSALSSRPSSRATSPIRGPVSLSRRNSGGVGAHAGPAIITNSIDAALAAGHNERPHASSIPPTSPLSAEDSSPLLKARDGLASGAVSPDLASPRSRPASGTFSPREKLAARMSSKSAHHYADAGLLGNHLHSGTQGHQVAAYATGTFPRPVSPALSTASMSDSMIFERDIESPLPPPVPSNVLEHRPSRRASRASGMNGVTGELSASAAQSLAHSQTHSVSNLHHHYTHGDFLESKIPTVLDDAIEALTALNESEKHLQAGGTAGGARSRLVDIEVESPVPITWPGVGGSTSATRLSNATTRCRPVSPLRSAVASPKASNPTSPLLESTQPARPRPQLSSRISSAGPALPGAFPTGNEQSSDSWRRKIQEWIGPKGFEEEPAPILPSKESEDVLNNKEAQAGEKDDLLPVASGTHRPTHPHSAHPLPSERHRISFVSYNDILTSHPLRVDPLSDITSGASGEPDHLPGTVSPAVSMLSGGRVLVPGVDGRVSRSVSLSRNTGSPPVPTDSPDSAGQARGSGLSGPPTSIQDRLGIHAHAAVVLPEERSKGEWEREGLGKGLQARLEELIIDGQTD
ncbi:hypothetical protein QFC22_002549 [Naganishia vaughanmartiniae]|uniref:Uncharacterized protein n=1 Tax=Naganishia vaughanmartiniae TaxID=1424756 RepID=A0ACC2XAM0_9TREE|nr:hypothetical protein QFC22_002549 [Naganishia vaughanmartiniae]